MLQLFGQFPLQQRWVQLASAKPTVMLLGGASP